MPGAPDGRSTAICRLFIELDLSIQSDTHPHFRDAHWYVGRYLRLWEEDEKESWGPSFQPGYPPFPWYREKDICTKVLTRAVAEARETIARRSRLYSVDDEDRMWNILTRHVQSAAKDAFKDYWTVLADRSRKLEELDAGG